MKKLLFITALFVLSTCATNVQTQLLLSCQTYIDTLHTLEPFKPQMSPEQISVVQESIRVADPICTGADLPDARTALDVVRAKLRELVTVNNQVNPSEIKP